MSQINPAILAGSVSGSGAKPDPARVTTLTSEAEALVAGASQSVAELQMGLTLRAADAAKSGLQALGDSVGNLAQEAIRRGNLGGKTAKRVVEEFDRQADDAYLDARRTVQTVGGDLPVLLEDHLAYKMANEFELPALEHVIAPIIDRRMADEMSGAVQADAVPPSPLPPPPAPQNPGLDTGPGPCGDTGRWAVVNPDGTWECKPYGQGCPPDFWYQPHDPVPPPPGAPPGVNFWKSTCGTASPPPASPPPAASPPPPSAPAPGGACCPSEPIIVPAPVVNITVQTGPATPTTPPPPGILDPLLPLVPPPDDTPKPPPEPPPPPPAVVGPGIQSGIMDGPQLCAALAANIALLDPHNHDPLNMEFRFKINAAMHNMGKIPVIGPLVEAVAEGAVGTMYMLSDWGKNVGYTVGVPNPAQAAEAISVTSIAGFAERWLGTPLQYWVQPFEQLGKFANPLNILGQSDIDSAFLADTITSDVWACLTKSNGNLPWQHQQAMLAKRTKPGVGELVQLLMRGNINDAEYYAMMRANGVLNKQDADNFSRLGTQLPTMTDLMQWMVKDVANEEFVIKGGLDEDFDKSWTPELQRLADMIGVTSEQIKYSYRAQWQDIPLGQLYQMFWRLRPGRVDPKLVFTEADLKFMMKIQEVQPGFRDRIKEIAYLPINRTDIMAAFTAGTMSEAEVYERFQDLGYNPVDAQAMTRMLVVKAQGQLQSSMGAWTKRKIMREYVGGSLTREDANKLLSRTVLDSFTRVDALDDADLIRKAMGRNKCIASIRKRYLIGEFDDAQAKRALIAMRVDVLTADDLVEAWACERITRAKEPTVKMLTDWVWRGIIDWAEMDRRLRNLGYSAADTERIRVSTDLDLREKQTKEQRAEADYQYKIRERGKKAKKEADAAAKPPKK